MKESSAIAWQSVFASQQCAITEKHALIERASEDTTRYQTEIRAKQQRTTDQHRAQVRFNDQQTLFSISMGQQFSGGFGVAVKSVVEQQQDNHPHLVITVDWSTPPKDAMTSSALTSPCEIVVLERFYNEAEFNTLTYDVVNQDGQLVAF